MRTIVTLATVVAIGLVFSAASMARSYPHVGGYKQTTQVVRAQSI